MGAVSRDVYLQVRSSTWDYIAHIYNMMYFAQGTQTNIFGDQVQSFRLNGGFSGVDRPILTAMVDWSSLTAIFVLMMTQEQFIRGVVEYSGSVFRGCLSVKNGTVFSGAGVPRNMTLVDTGRFYSQFVGWAPSISTFWVLIPGALIAIGTVYIVLRSIAHHGGNPRTEQAFDITNPMHVISGSAAGGISGVFGGSKEEDINAVKDVNVVLGTVEGFQGLALKRRHAK
ncbi:hypothetical protein C8R43DRAFT_956357 [Mycena crocata]|nr:hypothetical protein C8R43DRAFT_956357 [Mycena crocata]